jgi:hypothetical protein
MKIEDALKSFSLRYFSRLLMIPAHHLS